MSATYTVPEEISSAAPAVQEHFIRMIEEGVSPSLALMFALKSPPGAKGTDRAFFEGCGHASTLGIKDPWMDRVAHKEAREAGIATSGKTYKSGLADGRMWRDPLAWVGSADDVKKVCELRGYSCRGAVNYRNTRQVEPAPDVPLAPDIIAEFAQQKIAADPDIARKMSARELTEKIIHEHGSPARGKETTRSLERAKAKRATIKKAG